MSMYSEYFKFFRNSSGAGYLNQQVMVTMTSNGTVLFVVGLEAYYENEEVTVSYDHEAILREIQNGGLELSTAEQFLRLSLLVKEEIKMNQDLYPLGLKLP